MVSKALPAGSEALPSGSEALPAGNAALPPTSKRERMEPDGSPCAAASSEDLIACLGTLPTGSKALLA